jgi:hypothetical protein
MIDGIRGREVVADNGPYGHLWTGIGPENESLIGIQRGPSCGILPIYRDSSGELRIILICEQKPVLGPIVGRNRTKIASAYLNGRPDTQRNAAKILLEKTGLHGRLVRFLHQVPGSPPEIKYLFSRWLAFECMPTEVPGTARIIDLSINDAQRLVLKPNSKIIDGPTCDIIQRLHGLESLPLPIPGER